MKHSIKSLAILAASLLALSGCGQPAATQVSAPPAPSPTLERAPTRMANFQATDMPGSAATGPASGSSPSQTPATLIGTPVPPPQLNGEFVFSPGDGSVWVQDAASGKLRTVIKPSAVIYAEAPSFSPDGKRVVYMESELSATGAAKNSIRIVDEEGKNDHQLIASPDAKTTLGWPVFSPNGKWVYYTASYPVPPGGEHFEVQRVSSQGGASQPVVQNAQSAVLSKGGSQIVFTRFNETDFSASLWVAGGDGQNPREILADNIFSAIAASRFSPDGRWILFSASGPPMHPLPGALLLPAKECEPALLCALAGAAYANGLPWDLWLVSADGKHFQQLTNVGFDSPWPAWSGDGKYIAIFETSGFYVLDVNRRVLSEWKEEGGHGVMDWWTPGPK